MGLTALHFCAVDNNIEIASCLLYNKANPWGSTDEGHTAFKLAMQHGNYEIVMILAMYFDYYGKFFGDNE